VDSATLRTLLTAGRYQATTDMECLAASDAISICVPTPLRKSKDPAVSFVLAAAAEVNRSMPAHVVSLVADGLDARGKCLKGAQLLVLGLPKHYVFNNPDHLQKL
jgi:UDP-N-acetyl-D-mannosaminuronate dehydrogenase